MVPNKDDAGRIAYVAYGRKAQWKNFRGEAMLSWGELPEGVKACWRSAAEAVTAVCIGADRDPELALVLDLEEGAMAAGDTLLAIHRGLRDKE